MSAREFSFSPLSPLVCCRWPIVDRRIIKNAVFVFFVLLENIFQALPGSILKNFCLIRYCRFDLVVFQALPESILRNFLPIRYCGFDLVVFRVLPESILKNFA
jgi:hypothetical protein